MLKKPSEVKRFKTNNKQCSFVLTASCGFYVHSIAEQNIQLHTYIYHDLNQCVRSLLRTYEATLSIYLAFSLNVVWCLLTTATKKDISLDDEMVHCVTMPLQIWLAIRALWLVNTSMALLLLSNDTIVCTELTRAWWFIRCHSLFS